MSSAAKPLQQSSEVPQLLFDCLATAVTLDTYRINNTHYSISCLSSSCTEFIREPIMTYDTSPYKRHRHNYAIFTVK
eukprot:6456274-Amphidinium_carterae.1